jgi:signal transduction histidine kinase
VSDRNLLQSTHFRFALMLVGLFVLANLVAGWIAFQAIHDDLDRRVEQSASLSALELVDVFEADGRDALIAAVTDRSKALDPEDDVVWLGTTDGTYLAGHHLPNPEGLAPGDVTGSRLGQDADDTYLLTAREFHGLRLVTARSYEETDEIASTVLKAFGLATLFVTLVAGLIATVLSRRGQSRIEHISSVLRKVATGEVTRRIDTRSRTDDLGRLSERINDALEQLETTVVGIKQVSADVAHDLRTPINRLGIQIERLLEEVGDQPELESKLQQAAEEARKIASTFDAVLRITQIEGGARKAKFKAVPLGEVASALYDAYAAVAEDAGQTLLLSTPESGNLLVHGDRELLVQLGANLLENAIRYAGDGATIRLEAGSGLNGVWLSVADNGPGIPEDERDKVQQRFYRLDKARQTAGSGLGLALVKAIADLHSASLHLDDNHPGLTARANFNPFSDALKSND